MTDIDVATGLPKLEENQFWRVRERASNWYERIDASYSVVELIERVEIERKIPREFLGIRFGYWAPVREITENTLASQVMWDPGRPVTDEDYTGWAVTVDGKKYYPVSGDEVKAPFILAAAEKALEWYKSKKESRKLLGDYPPKSLPSGDA